jgi:VWFA-related protein
MHSTRICLGALMCAGVALVASGRSATRDAQRAAGPQSLVGNWRFNEKESEDPRLKFSRHRDTRPDETEPTRERWPRSDRPREQPVEKRAATGPREFLDSPRTLTIAISGSELTLASSFIGGEIKIVRLVVDGSEQKESGVTRVARWEGTSLVVESTLDAGGQMSTRYNALSGRKIEVYSRFLDQDGLPMTLRRVFDAADARAGPVPQPMASTGASQEVPTFDVTTELVYVRFHIERKGGPTDSLDKDQIRVLEDGRPQTIALLETPSTRERSIPPEVVLALDVSSSVMDAGLLDEALVRDVFFAGLGEETTLGLCAFGGELRCLVPPTRDIQALLDGLGEAMLFGRQTRNQGTRLYASVAEICNKAREGGKAQRALVIFSDGLDNRGGKVQEALQVAADTDMRVYAVKLSQAFRDTGVNLRAGGLGAAPNRALYDYKKFDLDRLASETGGRAYEPGSLDKKSVTGILRSIATEIKTEYIVGYQPDGGATGRKRQVKVELVDRSLGSVRGGERTLVR